MNITEHKHRISLPRLNFPSMFKELAYSSALRMWMIENFGQFGNRWDIEGSAILWPTAVIFLNEEDAILFRLKFDVDAMQSIGRI